MGQGIHVWSRHYNWVGSDTHRTRYFWLSLNHRNPSVTGQRCRYSLKCPNSLTVSSSIGWFSIPLSGVMESTISIDVVRKKLTGINIRLKLNVKFAWCPWVLLNLPPSTFTLRDPSNSDPWDILYEGGEMSKTSAALRRGTHFSPPTLELVLLLVYAL